MFTQLLPLCEHSNALKSSSLTFHQSLKGFSPVARDPDVTAPPPSQQQTQTWRSSRPTQRLVTVCSALRRKQLPDLRCVRQRAVLIEVHVILKHSDKAVFTIAPRGNVLWQKNTKISINEELIKWMWSFFYRFPPQDCFLKVKMSRFLEPLLLTGGGVSVLLGEDDGEGEEFWGVDVPP